MSLYRTPTDILDEAWGVSHALPGQKTFTVWRGDQLVALCYQHTREQAEQEVSQKMPDCKVKDPV